MIIHLWSGKIDDMVQVEDADGNTTQIASVIVSMSVGGPGATEAPEGTLWLEVPVGQ